MFQILAIISGVLAGLSHLPYLVDIIKKTTKPERASWFIWSVLATIAFSSQFAEGARWSLFFVAMDSFGVILTFLLSIKYGMGGLQRRDIIALIAAGIGLLLWYFTRHAEIALYITILIDLTGTVLTVIKSYEDPGSETFITWIGISIAAILGTISVGKLNFVLLIYPLYIFLANFAVVIAILLGRRQSAH